MRFAFLLVISCAGVSAQQLLTIADVEELAAKNHPRVAMAMAEVAAARAVTEQVRARQSPQLEGGITGSVAEHGTRLGIGGANAPDLFSRLGTGVSLSQLITDFGRTSLAVRSANENAQSRQSGVGITTAEVRLGARFAYYRALRAQASKAVAEQVRDARNLTLRQVRTFAESQLRSTLDVSFAEVRASEAELLVVRADNELSASLIELAVATGQEGPGNWRLQDPSPAPLALTVEEAISEAVRNRPDLEALRHQTEAARLQLQSDGRLHLPTVGATGVGGFLPFGDPRLRSRYGGAAVNITVPILNGHAFEARQQESAARLTANERQARDAMLRATAAIRLALLDLNTANLAVQTSRLLQEQAEKTLRSSQVRYAAGLDSIVEFNQAQLDAASALLGYASARYEAGLRGSRLEFELGRLR